MLDPGPIFLSEIDRYDDIGVEGALEQDWKLESVQFRLIEIDTRDIAETSYVKKRSWQVWEGIAGPVRESKHTPPIIVVALRPPLPGAIMRRDGAHFGMIDGMNRLAAHIAAGRQRLRAYEVISPRT